MRPVALMVLCLLPLVGIATPSPEVEVSPTVKRGTSVPVTVHAVSPGDSVWLAWDDTVDAEPCTTHDGACLDLPEPRILGVVYANETGEASFTLEVDDAERKQICMQPMVRSGAAFKTAPATCVKVDR